MLYKSTLFVFFSLVFLLGCNKEIDQLPIEIPSNQTVYFISNEGAFGFDNASLSLFYPDSFAMVNNAFEKVNNRKLGDVMQSVCLVNDFIFMVINSSNKIEVAHRETLLEQPPIFGLPLPRYMVASANQRAFVSCWGENGVVKVIDLANNTVVNSIKTGSGPEKMALANNNLIVCNSGGYTYDSTISIVDIASLQLINNLVVGDNPTDIVMLNQNTAWVLCRGKTVYGNGGQIVDESGGALVKVDFHSNQILKRVNLATNSHPTQLEISADSNMLFFGGGFGFAGIFTFDLTDEILSSQPIITNSVYGFNIHPITGIIYTLEAPNFTSAGKMKIYNKNGELLNEIKTGIGPNGIHF